MAVWYLGSNKHSAIAQWAATTAYSVGDIVRQLAAPSVDNERAFRCTTAGTSGGSEPSWNLNKGATTADGSAVWTEVTGNSTYGWAAAAARQKLFMNGGSSWAAAGDTVKRHASHAETVAAGLTLTSPGTAANPLFVYTVNDGDTALATGATITTTGSNSMTFAGFAYDYGVTYIAGSGGALGVNVNFNSANPNGWWLEEGGFTWLTTGTGLLAFGFNGANLDDRILVLLNSTLTYNSGTGSGLQAHGPLKMINGSVTGNANMSNFVTYISTGPGIDLVFSGVDLSIITNTLVAVNSAVTGKVLFEGCKLGNNVAVTSSTHPGQGSLVVWLVNSDSADTNYRYYKSMYEGTIQHEIVVVKSGGSSDGTTPFSRKMTSSANSKHFSPLVTDDIILFVKNPGSAVTLTVDVLTDNVTLTNAELWIEVEYPSSASTPDNAIVRSKISDPLYGTPANLTTSTSGWTTTGISTPVTQKASVTFTPQEKGAIRCRVCLAKASTTVYVDMKPSGI